MENGSSIKKATSKRGKRFRKLRWKNYLNHLLNLWLHCGIVSADGLNYYGVNGSESVNLYNKSSPDFESTLAAPLNCNGSFEPLSRAIASGEENETFKSFYKTSDFNKGNESNDDRRWEKENDSRIKRSNTSSSSKEIFDLIESIPVRRDESINHGSNLSRLSLVKGPRRLTVPGKIVDAKRMTSDIKLVGRVKKTKRIEGENVTGGGENKLSIRYQSSYRSSQLPKNPTNQTGRKKLKSDMKNPSSARNSTVASRGEKKLSKVSLLGLFEMTTHFGTRWEGRSELAAAELAVKHINERGLLPGYLLELITNDTQVSRR